MQAPPTRLSNNGTDKFEHPLSVCIVKWLTTKVQYRPRQIGCRHNRPSQLHSTNFIGSVGSFDARWPLHRADLQ
jgi:hypothetical protein